MTTSDLFKAHVDELSRRSEAGDEFATRTLACLALVCEGWRHGDPDPDGDGTDPGDGEAAEDCQVIDFTLYLRAA